MIVASQGAIIIDIYMPWMPHSSKCGVSFRVPCFQGNMKSLNFAWNEFWLVWLVSLITPFLNSPRQNHAIR